MITPRPHAQNTGFRWIDRAGTPRLLSEQQVADFDRDGYVLARNVIETDVIDRLRADIDTFELEAEQFLRRQPGGTMFIAAADQITARVPVASGQRLRVPGTSAVPDVLGAVERRDR